MRSKRRRTLESACFYPAAMTCCIGLVATLALFLATESDPALAGSEPSGPPPYQLGDTGVFEPMAFLPYVAKTLPPTPTPTPTPVSREWLIPEDLPCVALVEANVPPGEWYFRLIRAEWFDYDPPTIFVEVLDEAGNRMVGKQVVITWPDGNWYIYVKPDAPADYGMFNGLCSYSAHVTELPSDRVIGMGLGTPEDPYHWHHTHFNLTFQRTRR